MSNNIPLTMDQQLEIVNKRRMEKQRMLQHQGFGQAIINTPTNEAINDNLGFAQAKIHHLRKEGESQIHNTAQGHAKNIEQQFNENVQSTTQNVDNYVSNVQARIGNIMATTNQSIDSQMESGVRTAEGTAASVRRKGHASLKRKKTYAEKIGDGIAKVGAGVSNQVVSAGKNVGRNVTDVGNTVHNMVSGVADEIDDMFEDNVPGYSAVTSMFKSNKIVPYGDTEELVENIAKRKDSIHTTHNPNEFHHDGEADYRTSEERLKDVHDKVARDLLKDLKELGKIYTLCGDYYAHINYWLTLPTIIITAMSGFVSFLGGSTGIPEEWRQWFAVIVGFMATLATILGGFQSTFKWGSKSDQFLNAAQQLLILEGRLNFSILSDDDSLKDIQTIQETMQDISKGMRFFPPQNLVNKWWEMGMIDETQKREPLPSWAVKHLRDLRDLGINEKNDFRFITQEMLDKIDPPMSNKCIKKVYVEKAKQGGIMTSDAEKYLSRRTIRRLKAAGLWRDDHSMAATKKRSR